MVLWYCGAVVLYNCGTVLFMFYSLVFAEQHNERSQCCPRSGRGRGGRQGLTGSQSSEHGYWAAGWAGDSTGGYHETLRHHHHHHETTAGPGLNTPDIINYYHTPTTSSLPSSQNIIIVSPLRYQVPFFTNYLLGSDHQTSLTLTDSLTWPNLK